MRQVKFFITACLVLLFLSSNAQKGNLCQLLVKSFNASDEGFPFLRSGTTAETIRDFKIPYDTVANYELASGTILRRSDIESKKHEGKTFTAWTLLLSGSRRSLNDKKWDDVKETVAQQLTAFAKQYAVGCFPQLQMSELISPAEQDMSGELLTYYFYPKEINIPKSSGTKQIDNLLRESFYIKFSVKEPMIVSAYYMEYSVNGIKYNN